MIVVINQIFGQINSWKFLLSTNTTHDPSYGNWRKRDDMGPMVLKELRCMNLHKNPVILSQVEVYAVFI